MSGATYILIAETRSLRNHHGMTETDMLPRHAWSYYHRNSLRTFVGLAERGADLFVIARCIIVRQSLQLLQGLQIELLITALGLSALFP